LRRQFPSVWSTEAWRNTRSRRRRLSTRHATLCVTVTPRTTHLTSPPHCSALRVPPRHHSCSYRPTSPTSRRTKRSPRRKGVMAVVWRCDVMRRAMKSAVRRRLSTMRRRLWCLATRCRRRRLVTQACMRG
jgi:hypothetical protein